MQEITLPARPWNEISTSGECKEALDRSRVVQLGGLPLHFLDWLSPQVLQRLTSIKVYSYYSGLKSPLTTYTGAYRASTRYPKVPPGSLPKRFGCQATSRHGELYQYTPTYREVTEPTDTPPHVVQLHIGASGPGESYEKCIQIHFIRVEIVSSLMPPFLILDISHSSSDAGQGSRLKMQHISSKRSPWMRLLKQWTCIATSKAGTHLQYTAPSNVIQRLYECFLRLVGIRTRRCYKPWTGSPCWRRSLLVGLSISRSVNCPSKLLVTHILQVCILRDFKRIQKVYLYNHQHALPLPTSEIKVLLFQGESTIHTFGESAYTSKTSRFINVWRVRECSRCYQIRHSHMVYSGPLDI